MKKSLSLMLSGHFIPSSQGKIFLTQHGTVTTDTAILCLPPIVEEMNRARAVIAKQAQSLALMNMPCFMLDYLGTGDSEREFEEVNADIWLENIIHAGEYLQQLGIKKIILWGIRFGALLMLAHQTVLHKKLPIVQQILWKPVCNGKLYAGQFLRIKHANAMTEKPKDKVNWREKILTDHPVEVAGYVMTKTMLESWESLCVSQELTILSPMDWFELSANELSPATKRLSSSWSPELVKFHCFNCLAFWQVPEIFALSELSQFTIEKALLS